MCFGEKSKATTTTKHEMKHKNPCWSRELNPGASSRTPVGCVTIGPPSQLKVSIVVKPSTKSNLQATHFKQIRFFSVMFKYE